MKAVILADAHLKGIEDPNQQLLCSFINGLNDIDLLIILGDLFDFWTGYNSILYQNYSQIIESLKRLGKKGTKIIYVEGNHDFSLGAFFTEDLGIKVYSATAEVLIDGKRFLLTHGDRVDMRWGYRLWRWFLRSPLFRGINGMIPSSWGWEIAMYLSKKSRLNRRMGINLERQLKGYAREKIRDGFDMVATAHCHIACISRETQGKRMGLYVNPGDWAENHSYILYRDGVLEIKQFAHVGTVPILRTK